MMRKFALFLFPLAIFVFTPLLRPEDQKQKPQTVSERHEVVVTATRLETPAREVASSVTVLTAEDLARLKKTTVLEVLQEVVGLATVQSGGPGATASGFIRGANSEHTLVLMDGVELNDPMNPSRSFDLAHLPLESIERVEILRGPQSPLYGSDALGGIINIITKRGSGAPKIALSSAGGSYRTFANQAGISGSTDKIHYSFGVQHLTSQGISAASFSYPGNNETDGYKNLAFSGRLGVAVLGNLEIDLIARAISAKSDIDNFGGPYGDDPNNAQDYRSYFWRAQVRGLFLENRWEQKLGLSIVDSRRTHENLPDELHLGESENGRFDSRVMKVDWQNNFFVNPGNTLTFGFELEQEEGKSVYTYEISGGVNASLFPLQTATTRGVYIQDNLRAADRFFTTVGLRLDHHSQAGDAFTYRLASVYILKATGTRLKASLGTGFKSPSLYQLYAPATIFGPIGNEGLKPEKSLGWEAGFDQPLCGEKVKLGMTYFQNTFKNLISFDVPNGYINIGKAESKGIEVEAEARPTAGTLFKAAYTHLESRDRIKDTALPRRPQDTFFIALSHAFSRKWALSLSFNSIGKREDMNYTIWPALQVTLPAYSLLNGVISYDLKTSIQFFLRLDNILDEKYEMIYGYGAPGFSVQAGLKLSL